MRFLDCEFTKVYLSISDSKRRKRKHSNLFRMKWLEIQARIPLWKVVSPWKDEGMMLLVWFHTSDSTVTRDEWLHQVSCWFSLMRILCAELSICNHLSSSLLFSSFQVCNYHSIRVYFQITHPWCQAPLASSGRPSRSFWVETQTEDALHFQKEPLSRPEAGEDSFSPSKITECRGRRPFYEID